ncbi:P-loop NTPase [Streptacidiphilus sp. ASG 303]|uniref:tyrosine-protein kinase family protein n=1 Tax=Streptacidiphilus sp. ASG 303 TaxID=2896847 RepID=UPI001E561EBB|nr:tyrosine-protein kinase family protein [Streptacidiphilus sp. ASG 303]MCD0483754.1 P-loop NTPase [Streptacidiphilus sp. ASG 303]
MEPANHLTVLRRYWRLLVGCALAALVVGWLLTPAGTAVDNGKWQCKVSIVPAAGSGDTVKIDQVLSFATGSDVTQEAARKLGTTDIQGLLARREVAAVSEQMLQFTAHGPTQQSCSAVVSAFSDATITGYVRAAQRNTAASIRSLQQEQQKQQARLDALNARAAGAGAAEQARLAPDVDAARAAVTKTLTDISNLQNASRTDAVRQWGSIDSSPADGSILTAPSSRPLRLALAVVLGLALGVVAALMLDRVDSRLRSRNGAEEAFGLPVIGEIPVLSRRLRRLREPVVTARPAAPAAEAYRSLRSTLLLTGPASLSLHVKDGEGDGGPAAAAALVSRRLAHPAPVVLVMSGRSGDGKTTTVANLAAALAETGRQVLVLDCDFRHPGVHEHLGAGGGPGMAELLGGDRSVGVEDVVRPANVEGVSVIGAGNTNAYPAALVLRAGEVLQRVRRYADVVLVDTSPLLHANDAYDLVQHADAVLVTARSGNVTPEQAARVSELLARTGVPVAGVALTASLSPSGGGPRTGLRRSETTPAPVTPLGRGDRPRALDRTGEEPAAAYAARERERDRHAPSWARGGEASDGGGLGEGGFGEGGLGAAAAARRTEGDDR